MDEILALLALYGAIVAPSVWAIVQYLPQASKRWATMDAATRKRKRHLLAAAVGPLLGVAVWAVGWSEVPGDTWYIRLAGSALAGELSTILAIVGHKTGKAITAGKGAPPADGEDA